MSETIQVALLALGLFTVTYLAALAEVSLRAPDDRARATAGLFVYAYFGLSLPVIASGVLADRFGLLPAMMVFGTLQLAITIAIVAIWRRLSNAPNAALHVG